MEAVEACPHEPQAGNGHGHGSRAMEARAKARVWSGVALAW